MKTHRDFRDRRQKNDWFYRRCEPNIADKTELADKKCDQRRRPDQTIKIRTMFRFRWVGYEKLTVRIPEVFLLSCVDLIFINSNIVKLINI